MKKIALLFFLMATVIVACKKYNSLRDDINGNLYIRGRLFRVNNITNNSDTTAIASGTVNIGYFPDTVNYIYNVPTDANGYFVFNNLTQGKHYIITTGDTSGGVRYFAKTDQVLNASTDQVQLYSTPSQSGQNGIVYTVIDQNNELVNGCAICMFSSKLLYTQALALDTCIGGSYNLTSNAFGKASQLNLPVTATPFYTFFRARVGNIIWRGYDTVTMAQQGIIHKKPIVIK